MVKSVIPFPKRPLSEPSTGKEPQVGSVEGVDSRLNLCVSEMEERIKLMRHFPENKHRSAKTVGL